MQECVRDDPYRNVFHRGLAVVVASAAALGLAGHISDCRRFGVSEQSILYVDLLVGCKVPQLVGHLRRLIEYDSIRLPTEDFWRIVLGAPAPVIAGDGDIPAKALICYEPPRDPAARAWFI